MACPVVIVAVMATATTNTVGAFTFLADSNEIDRVNRARLHKPAMELFAMRGIIGSGFDYRLQRAAGIGRIASMLGTILLIVLIIALFGALPRWGYSTSWGYGPSGIVGTVLVVVIVLLLLGRL